MVCQVEEWNDVEVAGVGGWLVEHRRDIDRGEARWLERLTEFDRDQLWSLDGQLSCVTWLVWQTNMARSTAFEKLRVAHELARRPIVAEAFRHGRISYSAARAITRIDRPDADVDEALVNLAQSGRASILDVERAVRAYGLYADQERPPPEPAEQPRDVKILRGDDGRGQIIVTLGDIEIEEFAAAFGAFLDQRYRPQPVDQSSGEDSLDPDPGDESSREDFDREAPLEEPNRAERLANRRHHRHRQRVQRLPAPPPQTALRLPRRRRPQPRTALLPPQPHLHRLHLPRHRPPTSPGLTRQSISWLRTPVRLT
jgi:hypothetical protein